MSKFESMFLLYLITKFTFIYVNHEKIMEKARPRIVIIVKSFGLLQDSVEKIYDISALFESHGHVKKCNKYAAYIPTVTRQIYR